MTTLPTEIITEILSFLPPKSLCRLKSVAKSWHFLITSDTFIKLHLSKTLISDQPPILILRHYSLSAAAKVISSAAISSVNPNEIIFSVVDHPVKHFPEFANARIIGSCRGILCISDYFQKNVLYFNPSTKTHRLIPPAPPKIPAMDPGVISGFGFGFGYDSSVDDYKLLRITECYVKCVCICREVRLYSMRSNSWKFVKVDFDYKLLRISEDYPVQQMHAVHVNGVLYFVVSGMNNRPFVKCFDLKTEEFTVFDMFEYDKSFNRFSFMSVELRGCLAVMTNYSNKDLSVPCGWKFACAELWVRKEVSWVRVFRVPDPFKIGSLICIRPVTYSKDGGRVLFELESLDGTKFCWFDWRSNKFTKVWAHGIPSSEGLSFFDTYTFVPSIVSLRSDEDKANDEQKDVNKKNLAGFLSTGFKLRL